MNAIRFHLNGTPRTETGVSPSATVLDWLRAQGLTGTKEGCAEGDCGACTIVLKRQANGATRYEAVNSCLMLLPQLDGHDVLTVEGIAQPDGTLNPVQQALIDTDGTQCGFCTPGFVMAMVAFAQGEEPRDEMHIHEALAGNLCRCTGYRAIVDACRKLPAPLPDDDKVESAAAASLTYKTRDQKFFAPISIAELLDLRAHEPAALILGGGTDLGIRASKDREAFPCVISTAQVRELQGVRETNGGLEIGGAATYSDALPSLDKHFPAFGKLVRRIGSRQIRNLGTIAGNIVTASPIGDTTPCLIALGAEVELRSLRGTRKMPVEQFITGYRKTALAPDEIVAKIRIPFLPEGARFAAYKLSKRFDQDISAVIAAFYLNAGVARAVYGGMADRPKRAAQTEALISDGGLADTTPAAIEAALARDFSPMSDHRASAVYRTRAAAGLVRRFQLEPGASQFLSVEAL